MRRDYTLTTLIIPILILAFGLLLFGTLEATQIDIPDCEQEQRIKSDCFPRGERPTCPNMNPTPRCPLEAVVPGQLNNKGE